MPQIQQGVASRAAGSGIQMVALMNDDFHIAGMTRRRHIGDSNCILESLSLVELERPDLLPVRIAELIREAIIDGRLKPGERLIEQHLSRQWNVSRSPLREAIRQLASEGLVTLSAHKGARVSEVSIASFREVFAVRGILEASAAELAAQNATANEVAILRQLVADMDRSQQAGEPFLHFYKFAVQFDDVLMAASHNSVLIDLYGQVKRQYRRYQATMPRGAGLLVESTAAHREIAEAVAIGDAPAAADAARRHIQSIVTRFEDDDAFLMSVGDPKSTTAPKRSTTAQSSQ